MKRIVTLLVLLAAVAGATWLYRRYYTSTELILTGIVTTHDVSVSPLIQGRLAEILVKEGDQVKAGQLIAVLDPQELKADRSYYELAEQGAAARVRQDEAALRSQETVINDQIAQAEAALAAVQAQEPEAAANLELTKSTFERTEGLYRKQVYSSQALDQARTAHEAAQARIGTIRKQVESAKAAVALAKANATQLAVQRGQIQTVQRQLRAAGAQTSKADVRLSYTEVHAPINGVVAVLSARRGEVLGVSQPVLSLIDPDDLWVRADVEETYIDRIRLGDQIEVRLSSGDRREGKVFFRAVDAEYATQRDVSRTKRDIKTFEIRLRLDNADRRLWPGMTAYVVLPKSQLQVDGQ
jgi:HlyD family secretion protein